MKAKVLIAEADHDEPRQLVVAYDALEEGRQMMSWVSKYCLASDDQLHIVHYQVCDITTVFIHKHCSSIHD